MIHINYCHLATNEIILQFAMIITMDGYFKLSEFYFPTDKPIIMLSTSILSVINLPQSLVFCIMFNLLLICFSVVNIYENVYRFCFIDTTTS